MAAPVSRLGRQIAEVTAALRAIDAQFALIGGDRTGLLDALLREID